tara:strand:- start:2522 stop:2944 length:423 start_codon:yes stop_codon:yes gene_type:complete
MKPTYENFSCVYSLQCKDKEIKEIYIGSTKNYRSRKGDHKIGSTILDYKVYKFIRENGGWDNWDMIVEDKTPNHTKEERLELEQIYINLLQPILNDTNSMTQCRKQNSDKQNKKNDNCPICGLEMRKRNIKKHIGRKHKA